MDTDLKDTCACCEIIDCINLFDHKNEDPIFLGGELYLFKRFHHEKIMEEKLDNMVCSNGDLIQIACYLITDLNKRWPDEYVILTTNEVVRDMKASFFLAISGHYRQSIQILRCIFENFLYGMYFSTESKKFVHDDDGRKRLENNFRTWIEGDFQKNDCYLRDIIKKGGYITDWEYSNWGKLYAELCKYIHTIKQTLTGRKILHGDIEITDCYSVVEYNEERLLEWSKYYQQLFFLILYQLINMFPDVKKGKMGKEALKIIKQSFQEKKEKLDNMYLDKILDYC